MPYFPPAGGGVVLPNSISDGTVKGRAVGAGTGDPQDLTQAQLAGVVATAAPLSYRNILGRNGGFEVWQRSAGGSANFGMAASAQQYVSDGWWCLAGAQTTVLQSGPLVYGSRWSIYIARNAGQTGVSPYYLEFPLDTDEIVPMRNSIVTLSLTMYAGANWSPASGYASVQLLTGTGAPARILAGAYAGQTLVIPGVSALVPGGAATRYSFTSAAVVPTNATQATVLITWTPVGTAGAADSINIDDVQLEIGTVATPFERRPFESELLACRRHYWKTFSYNTAPIQNSGGGGMFRAGQIVAASTFSEYGPASFPVPMRAVPTVTVYNPLALNTQMRNFNTSTDFTSTSIAQHEWGTSFNAVSPAGSVPGNIIGVHITADAGI
jgi:hypothetical protein